MRPPMSKLHRHQGRGDLVKTLVESRESPAVLKLKLIQLRTRLPSTLIFAFEGDDDKLAYYQWIRRINPELVYEPFNCRGRNNVLLLREIVSRDMGGLKETIYFFVDRDFEDIGTRIHRDLFITDAYSIENYLVSEDVLDELLKNEFHCDGEPDVRQEIITLFSKLYSKFLEYTKEANKILFVCKRSKCPVSGNVPDKIELIADIRLDDVCELDQPMQSRWKLTICIDDGKYKSLKEEFESLDPRMRYRGKFALRFFMRWLHCLVMDRNSTASRLFTTASRSKSVNYSDISISALASKSRLPQGLSDFINGVATIA